MTRSTRTQMPRISIVTVAPYVVLWCLLAVANFAVCQQAVSQQSDTTAPADQTNTGTVAIEDHSRCGGPELCDQPDQRGSSLPNAPSAYPQRYSKVNSLTFGDRARIYRQAVLRPYTLVGPALGAGIGQWENEPPGWGQGSEGYARRFASGVGRSVIAETIRFGFAAADGEDPRYHRSQERGVWNRTRHVLAETFTSETAGGTRIPAFSRFAGVYGAAFISNTWYPESRATTGYALRRGSTALASSLGFHLFEEFVPRKYFNALHIGD
jgi:hypothetical protein